MQPKVVAGLKKKKKMCVLCALNYDLILIIFSFLIKKAKKLNFPKIKFHSHSVIFFILMSIK